MANREEPVVLDDNHEQSQFTMSRNFHWHNCNLLDCMCESIITPALLKKDYVLTKFTDTSFVEVLFTETLNNADLPREPISERIHRKRTYLDQLQPILQPSEKMMKEYLKTEELFYDIQFSRLIDSRKVNDQPHVLDYGRRTLLIAITLRYESGLRIFKEKPLLKGTSSGDKWLLDMSEDLGDFDLVDFAKIADVVYENYVLFYNPMLLHAHHQSRGLSFVIPVYNGNVEVMLDAPLKDYKYRSIIWLLMRASHKDFTDCLVPVYEWEQRNHCENEEVRSVLYQLLGPIVEYKKSLRMGLTPLQVHLWRRTCVDYLKNANNLYVGN